MRHPKPQPFPPQREIILTCPECRFTHRLNTGVMLLEQDLTDRTKWCVSFICPAIDEVAYKELTSGALRTFACAGVAIDHAPVPDTAESLFL